MTAESQTIKPAEKKPTVTAPAALPVAKSGKQPLVSEVSAKARFIHVAPRKVRLVIAQLKGKPVVTALGQLRFIRKAATRPITKLLDSAVANAEHNFKIDRNDLFIKHFTADGGPTLKRYRPRAHGRSAPIGKRTSHLTVILGVKPGARLKTAAATKKSAAAKAPAAEPASKTEVKIVSPETIKKDGPKATGRGPEPQGRNDKGFLKKMFQRKTG